AGRLPGGRAARRVRGERDRADRADPAGAAAAARQRRRGAEHHLGRGRGGLRGLGRLRRGQGRPGAGLERAGRRGARGPRVVGRPRRPAHRHAPAGLPRRGHLGPARTRLGRARVRPAGQRAAAERPVPRGAPGAGDFMIALADFTLPASLEAHEPPEARGLPRDGVRMLVSRRASGEISHHGFAGLPGLLLPGDLLVVNTTATLPAQVRVSAQLAVHFSGTRPDGSWLTELRQVTGKTTVPNGRGYPGQRLILPGGAVLFLEGRATNRLWRARLSVAVIPYLLKYGRPIRYSYVSRDWPLSHYQTVFAREPGSAEMPSASRPFSPSVVTRLVSAGVLIAPLTLHCGVSSLEG